MTLTKQKGIEAKINFLNTEMLVDFFFLQGMTALHWAAFHGRTGHVSLLMEKKADLLSRDTDGKLPLHWAAQVFNTFLILYTLKSVILKPLLPNVSMYILPTCSVYISSGADEENLFDKQVLSSSAFSIG